ncbi:MAG: protein-arginine deiminase domain-containing protein, partial [Salinisphaera sp.]|nr:protein-arginine deiminase domain-containing protein [Salinisphaera sp.]
CERDSAGISVNGTIDDTVLTASRTALADATGAAILLVPVLFDRIDSTADFRQHHARNRTSAFTPDMANMQVLNGHLMVPKPYGPRMCRDDAIAVVRAAMEMVGMPRSVRDRVGPRLVARRRMTREVYWVEKVAPAYLETASGIIRASFGGMQDKDDVIAGFKDSFPDADAAELERRLIRPNNRHFTSSGQLRDDFTQLIINDGMVDLFELWTAAVAEETGSILHFIDTWAYHLGDGQIHCGTNVVRRPRRVGGINVWDAPDHEFRSGVVVFTEEEVAIAR